MATLPTSAAQSTSSQRRRHTLSAHLPLAPFELNGAYMVNPSVRLGAGMWAQVVKGIEIASEKPVAVKLVSKSSLAEKDLRMLKNERNVYETARHPNIIAYKGSFEDDSYLYFVLEYRGGGDLFSFVKRSGRLPYNTARLYFKQIVSAIQYMHRMMICHRDIKLENILLDEAFQTVVVADFGLSAATGNLLTTWCGSPCYAAPEVVKRIPYDGTLSDIWALGVCLFTMTAGRFPYYDDSVAVVLKKILNDPINFSSAHTPLLRDLLKPMLCKDAESRISLGDILKHPWMQPPPVIHERPSCPPRRASLTSLGNRIAA